ncbi:MAG TPA: SdpI family protein [Thermoanaerobaculia bacterium]|nr:SdpI family protein [Thermoanaerobaculia bacterium]
MIPPVVVHCGVGALVTVLSLPLVLRKVPMNRAYGVRVRKAFTSESNWYDINAYGGKLLLAYGLALVAFGLLARDAAPPPASIWTAPFVVGPLVLVFPILGLISAYARRLP